MSYMKICSTSLIIGAMQIKTTVRYYSHLLEWLLSQRQEITGVLQDVKKREHFCTVSGNRN